MRGPRTRRHVLRSCSDSARTALTQPAMFTPSRRRTPRFLVMGIVALFVLASCKGDSTAPPSLTKLSVTTAAASVVVGQTTTATASGVDQNGASISTGTVTWSVGSSAVATVNTITGTVTGVAPGTTQVIATAGKVSGEATITVQPVPAMLTTVSVAIPNASLQYGQTTTASAVGLDQYGKPFSIGTVTWSASAATIVNVNAATGLVTGVSAGIAQITATTGGKTSMQTVTVLTPPALRINEVESSDGVPGDWIELYNASTAAIDLSGWGVRDNDSTHTIYRIPTGTLLPAGGYYVVEEAQFGFGLGAPDEARLYNPFGALIEVYGWTTHATTTYGRCPNGTGPFVTMGSSTKGVTNDCSTATPLPTPATAPWPGSDDVTTVDGLNVFGGNLSGLMYETAKGGQPNVLWGIRNEPGSLFRLIFSGGIWTPDAANGWSAGKRLSYPDGTGEPDSEGVTFTSGGSTAGMYVSAERDNKNNGVSRISVLRYDPSSAGTTLRATNEWNLTSDLPVSGANLGAEAIAWIPDDVLVARKFFDEKANRTYNPADYTNHGTGIFFVGLESNGNVYAFALNHADNTFTRIATFSTGYPTGVMDLNFDPATNYLWAVCDDGCGGVVGIFEIESNPALATFGRFRAPRRFARPSTMPNINNEGFALTTQAECVNGSKPVFWADDNETGGHAIRRATLPCGVIPSPALQALRSATPMRR